MTVPTYDLFLRRGNDTSYEFHLKSDDGTPFDLTGSILVFTARMSDYTKLEKTILPTDAEAGSFVLSFAAAETGNFAVGRFIRWEVERRLAGSEETLLAGYVNVQEGINVDG